MLSKQSNTELTRLAQAGLQITGKSQGAQPSPPSRKLKKRLLSLVDTENLSPLERTMPLLVSFTTG